MSKEKIPLVLVSRSFNGIVSPVYAYEGGGADLKIMVLFFERFKRTKGKAKITSWFESGHDSKSIRAIFRRVIKRVGQNSYQVHCHTPIPISCMHCL